MELLSKNRCIFAFGMIKREVQITSAPNRVLTWSELQRVHYIRVG